MDRGDDDLVRCKTVHEHTDGGDIRQGVQGTHLVKMDVGDGNAVHRALRLRQEIIHGQNVLSYPLRQRKRGDPTPEAVEIGVGMVLLPVVVSVGRTGGLMAMDEHRYLCAQDPAFGDALSSILYAGKPQRVQPRQESAGLRQ